MGSLYNPRQRTSYIIEDYANNYYGWVMSQEMSDGDCEWLSEDECRDMGLLVNYEDGGIAIFDTKLFDHRENEEEKNVLFSRWTWSIRHRCTSAPTTID